MLRRAVPVLTATVLVLAGCGGPSAQERRTKSAEYQRAAQRVCGAIKLAPRTRFDPIIIFTLDDYVERARSSLTTGAERLHDLRGTLGDSASPAAAEFDRRIDPAVASVTRLYAATQGIDTHPLIEQAPALTSAAATLRRAFAELYQAAGAADLKACGRGGNRMADIVLLSVYRERYYDINSAALYGYGQVRYGERIEKLRAGIARRLRVASVHYRRINRLNPPAAVRDLHDRYRHLLARAITLEREGDGLLAQQPPNIEAVNAWLKVERRVGRLRSRQRVLERQLARALTKR